MNPFHRSAILSAAALALLACTASHQESKASAPMAAVDAGPAVPPAPLPPPPPPSTPDAAFRDHAPPPSGAPAQFAAPVPSERTLKNGAKLLVVENHAVPLVAIELLIETGVDGEPAGKAGLASFVAAMLEEGTKTRSATQLAEQLEDLAANYSAFAGQETVRVHLNCLTETLPQALELLADMVTHPAFRKEDVERVRGLLLTQVAQKQANPTLLARDEMARILYGEKSPWGQPAGGTEETLRRIGIADLNRFHGNYFRPTNAILSVSGDVTEASITRLVEEKLGAWKKLSRLGVKLPAVAASSQRTLVLVDKPGASQSQVWAFKTAVPAKDPDALALRVASYILGGPFARLDLNLREGKGYSYGVRASPNLMREHGTWLVSAGVKANVTAEALAEYEKELTALSTGELREGELATAKEALARSVPSTLERNDSVASAMATLAFNGQPLDYYRTLPAELAKVDAAAVARVAAKYDRPDAWSIAIVGPRAVSEEKLRAMHLGVLEVKSSAAAP